MKKYSFLVLVLLFSACEKDAKVKLPDLPVKVVMVSFISPQDSIITVKVFKTSPVYGVRNTNYSGYSLTGAKVELSDGEKSVILTQKMLNPNTPDDYKISTKLFPILAGKTYALNVILSDGLQAKASCTVPFQANTQITQLKLDSTDITNSNSTQGYKLMQYNLSAEWQDFPAEPNFYRMYAELVFVNNYSNNGVKYSNTTYRPVFSSENLRTLTNDKNNEGGIFFVKDGIFNDYTASVSPAPPYPGNSVSQRKINIFLLTTDIHYYEYHRSLKAYQNSGGGDNPFSEPVLIYTNVEGGLGVFAGYQRFTKTLKY